MSDSSKVEQSIKLFNTAIIATKIPKTTNYASQLTSVVQSKPFQAILEAIRQYSKEAHISEDQAAEEIVQAFRKIDLVWDEYIFQEGLEKLKGHLST